MRTAVIGTNIGSTLHIRALQAAGFEVAALIGRNPETTAQRAAHFGIEQASTSLEDVLAGDIDVVVVATPPAFHHPMVMAAIAAGKHVLCEKPLATNSRLAIEMRDAAEAAGVVHVLQHQLRWLPSNAILRDVIAKGTLGQLIQGSFEFEVPMMQKPQIDVPDWWLSPETGGGWLRNWNTHGIDLIRYMVGEFGAVSGRLHDDPGRGMSSDDSYVINFALTNGMQGAMIGSCRTWYPHVESRVIGSDGTAVLKSGAAGQATLVANGEGVQEIAPSKELLEQLHIASAAQDKPDPGLPAMGDGEYQAVHTTNVSLTEQISLCTAFRRRILDRSYTSPAMADFSDGVEGLRVIEAVERACETRRWVDIG